MRSADGHDKPLVKFSVIRESKHLWDVSGRRVENVIGWYLKCKRCAKWTISRERCLNEWTFSQCLLASLRFIIFNDNLKQNIALEWQIFYLQEVV